MGAAPQGAHGTHVVGNDELLAQALALIALIAGTIEYRALLTRREALRVVDAERELAAESGLAGLVRVLLVD